MMKLTRCLFIAVASFLFCTAMTAFAQSDVLEWDGEPVAGLKTVRYRAWIPEGVNPLAGTLILIPGRHQDGRGMAQDRAWQELAGELKFAIMACQFADGDPFLYQNDPKAEVSKALDEAAGKLAELSKHRELAKAPFALWGHSAGSNVSSHYTSYNPKRVAAFGSTKGTSAPGTDFPPGKAEIPMLIALGQKDKPEWVKYSTDGVEAGLKKNAPIILALNVNEGHEPGGSVALIQTFFRSVIPMRLGTAASAAPAAAAPAKTPFAGFTSTATAGAPGGGGGGGNLKRISQQAGWLGNPETYEVTAFNDYKGQKNKAVWLPDEATAKAWQDYLK